jgi:hypothetical protein
VPQAVIKPREVEPQQRHFLEEPEIDYDTLLAIQIQKEEMELNEQLFLIEMIEEKERVRRQRGDDDVDPDNMTYEVVEQ